MPGKKQSRKRSTRSSTPSPTQPLRDGAAKLARAIQQHIGGSCSTKEEFYSIMEPATDLVGLAPSDWKTCPAAVGEYLLTAHFKTVGQLMSVLAWSAPAVVPGHTPFGMEPLEGARMWGDVAAHCVNMIGTALPALRDGGALLVEVLDNQQLPGLPGGG
jgi:hypothetical protein